MSRYEYADNLLTLKSIDDSNENQLIQTQYKPILASIYRTFKTFSYITCQAKTYLSDILKAIELIEEFTEKTQTFGLPILCTD